MKRFDLFLDESGDFELDGDERKNGRAFQSQIAGFAAPAGLIDEAAAGAVLQAAFDSVGQLLPKEVHGTLLVAGLGGWEHLPNWKARKAVYSDLIRALVREMRQRGMQPIRLVNREGVRLESRTETQVAMTAALAIRAARLLEPDPRAGVAIDLRLASVSVGNGPRPVRIAFDDYATALEREIALALARHEISRDEWRIEVVSIAPARKSRALQIADLISHASHARFAPLNTAAKGDLIASLGAFDISLAVPVAIEQSERSLAHGAVGVALQVLGEREIAHRRTETADHASRALRERALDALAASSPETRDDHLSQIVSWLRLLVTDIRNLEIAVAACQWVLNEIDEPLRRRLADGAAIGWFAVAARSWLLTAYNHSGKIAEGRDVARAIETGLAELAGRWEQAPQLLGSLLTLAVYANDRRDFDDAILKADAVASFFSGLSDLFSVAMPGRFPARVRSNLHGKALGTALQARLHRGALSPAELADARRISDEAIAEFAEGPDRRRQQQYRCFLETLARDFAASRSYLGLALETEATHAAIGAAIATQPHAPRGFLLLHWLRLGASARLAGDIAEVAEFDAAFQETGLSRDEWCLGGPKRFPVHGVLLHLAAGYMARGEWDAGLPTLRRLVDLVAASRAPALAVIAVGALARAASGLLAVRPSRARKLLTGASGDPGSMTAMLRLMQPAYGDSPGAAPILSEAAAILAEFDMPERSVAELSARLAALADRIIV